MSVWNQSWDEWRLWGPGYGWSTRYTATCKITVTRSIGSDTATVKVEITMTTPSGDNALGDWQCITTINGATSGGGEKNIVVASAGYHAANSSYSVTQTFTVGVGVSAGTLSGTVKFRIGGYPGYQGEYSEEKSWSLSYDSKGTPSQATWSNYYWGKESTVTIQRTVPAFRESVYLVWSDNTTTTLRTYTQTDTTTVKYTIPYNACPTNAKTRVAKIRVVTYNGDTQVGTWESANYTVALLTGDTTYLPTLANNPVCEAYNDVVAALGTDTAVAQYSKLNVKAAKADVSCKYSATIVSRVVTFGNGSSASADQTNHISSLIQAAGAISWTYTVTDSRGYTVTRSGTYTVINSSAPSIENITVYRGDSGGTAQEGGAYIYATATATCESLNGHNSVTLQGKVDSGAYQSMTSGTRKTLKSDANANTQYVVTLKATDLLRATTQTIILPSSDVPLDVPETKHAMGIGMQAQASDDTLYVGYKAKHYGDIIKHDSVKNIDYSIPEQYYPLIANGTVIPANANLNTTSYVAVGLYYQDTSSTVVTFTNCPTTDAFTMIVRNVTKHYKDTQLLDWQYIVREITDINGNKYVQNANCTSVGIWTFGSWYREVDTRGGITFSGQIKTSFKASVAMGSYQAVANTIPDLATELRYSSGCCGSVYISTAYTLTGDTMNTGWYNFLWIPHRSGGVNGQASSDNTSYGTCFLSAMNHQGRSHILRFANGSIAELRQIVTNEVFKDTYTNTSVKNGSAICRRQGNVISISASGGVSSLSANNYVNWVTIGERYRPTEAQFVNVSNGVVSGRFAVINTNGVIQLFSSTAITSATNFAFNHTYIVD